jgi:hypothetical protein
MRGHQPFDPETFRKAKGCRQRVLVVDLVGRVDDHAYRSRGGG